MRNFVILKRLFAFTPLFLVLISFCIPDGSLDFYVAEAWFNDGDKVVFIDDMRLAKRIVPQLGSCTVTSRTFPRGTSLDVRVNVERPVAETNLRCRITDINGKEQLTYSSKPALKEQRFIIQATELVCGEHYAVIELLDKKGLVMDESKQYFRSLQPGKRSYLKLITFYTQPLCKINTSKIAILNNSAYDGVAIPMMGSYETGPVPSYESLKLHANLVRNSLIIDPWPWVSLNRMIGASTDRRGNADKHADNLEYFHAIKGMDLDNETGSRNDFLRNWRNAVVLAREWKSPGVMIDLEAYNDKRTYRIPYLAKMRNESIDQVIKKCEGLGADMAKVIAEEYPTCVVWSLFSGLEQSTTIANHNAPVFTSPGNITIGILNYAKSNHVPLKYLCGGEATPGYCNKSVDILKDKIARRDGDIAFFLEQFPNHLFLAGVISPFHDYNITTSFIKKGYEGSNIMTIEDLEPFFRVLFDAYDWVWIYASGAAKTQPYNPELSARYGQALKTALIKSAGVQN